MTEPEIIYEDNNFLAINKPSGLLVHGSRIKGRGLRVAEPTLVDWLLKRYPEIRMVGDDPKTRPGIVHRLDRDASGVMLVPRTQKYFEYLKSLFQKRDIKKTYLALVRGELKEKRGIINRPLGVKSGTTKRSVHSDKMAKDAITEYKVIKVFKNPRRLAHVQREPAITLLEVMPRTGRTHQIRVHLASIGHPIVGDRLYGGSSIRHQASSIGRLMLHALSLEFTTAEGRRLKLEAAPPKDFQKIVPE